MPTGWAVYDGELADPGHVAALESTYPGRVLGVCAHLQGTRGGTTYPPLWQVL